MSLSLVSSFNIRIRTVSSPSSAIRIRSRTDSNRNVTQNRKIHTKCTLLSKPLGTPRVLLIRDDCSSRSVHQIKQILDSSKSFHNTLQNTSRTIRLYSTTPTLPEDPANWNPIQVFEWVVKNQYITKEERDLFEQMKMNGKDLLFAATRDLFEMGGLSLESALKLLEGIKHHLQPKFILAYMNRLKPAKKPLQEIYDKQAIHALGEYEYKSKLINQAPLIKELWRSKFDHYMAFRGDDRSPERINRIFITGAPGSGKTKFLLCSKPLMLEYAKTTGLQHSRQYENQLQEALEKGHTFFIDWNSKETPVLRFELKRDPESMVASRILWQVFQPQGITWQDFILKMPPNYSFFLSDTLTACRKHFGHDINDVVAWDIYMDNLEVLADLGVASGAIKGVFKCMSRRHEDTNDVMFCTMSGASLSTIDDIVFLEDPIITHIELKSLSFAETVEHVQDLYDRGSLTFLPSNWKENQNLMTLLGDAGGHPKTVHFVLKAVKETLECVPATLESLDWQAVVQRVFTSLSSICRNDSVREALLSSLISKSLVTGEFMRRQSVSVMRKMGFFVWERLALETVDEQGLALLDPVAGSDFYRLSLPFLWFQRYVAMTSPSWNGKLTLKPQVMENLLPSKDWGFLTNPSEYPLDPAAWNNFIPRYEQLRTNLFIKQGETFAVLQDFFRGAFGKQVWQDVEIELAAPQLVSTAENFPEKLLPVEQASNEAIDWFVADKIVELPSGATFSFRRTLGATPGAAPKYAAIFTLSQWPQRPLTATDLTEARDRFYVQWNAARKSLESSLHPKILEQLAEEQAQLDMQKRQQEAEERMAELRRKRREEFEAKRKEAFANAQKKWLISDTDTQFDSIFKQELDKLIPPSKQPAPRKQPEAVAPPKVGTVAETTPQPEEQVEVKQQETIEMTPEQQTAWDRYSMMKNADVILVAITGQAYDFGPVDELDAVDDSLYHWYNTEIEAEDRKQYKVAKLHSKIPDGCLVLAAQNMSSYFGPFSPRVWQSLSHK